jgi:hypothetical protein
MALGCCQHGRPGSRDRIGGGTTNRSGEPLPGSPDLCLLVARVDITLPSPPAVLFERLTGSDGFYYVWPRVMRRTNR